MMKLGDVMAMGGMLSALIFAECSWLATVAAVIAGIGAVMINMSEER